MAKRTVTRFLHCDPSSSGFDMEACHRSDCKKVKMEWDDGLPEPECLPKLNQSPETRERRIEGFVSDHLSEYSPVAHIFTTSERDRTWPATLIIHEPVKEMTLVEAVQALVDTWRQEGVGISKEAKGLREALAREKAKK
jgi:hypothetical protein